MIWEKQPRNKASNGLAYLQQGDGPPLLLIHGVGLRSEAWGAVTPTLAQRYTVFAVDMPGHGESQKCGTTLEDFVSALSAFLEQLPGPICVAGHSMGALLALELAFAHPDKVRAVAALNAIYQRTPTASKAVLARANAMPDNTVGDPSATIERWFGPAPVGAQLDAANACHTWLTSADPVGYKTAYQIFAEQNGPNAHALTNLRIPALFLTAEHDPNSTPRMSEALAAQAPLGNAISIADSAHMVPMTHGDIVAKALMDHFAN